MPSTAASHWGHIVASHDPHTIDVVGNLVVQLVFWWIPCAFFLSLDSLLPSFSARHKIQPAPKQPTTRQILDAALVSLRNQAMLTVMQIGMAYLSIRNGHPPALRVVGDLPPLGEFVRDVAVSLLLREVFFYYSHRLFHWRPLYIRIHKIHHRFTAPVALSSQYAHPVEHVIANALPIVLPPLILHSHVLSAWVFTALILVETSTVHSGYDFLNGAARKHDRHHERFNVFFGAFGLLDYIHGTGETLDPPKGSKGE